MKETLHAVAFFTGLAAMGTAWASVSPLAIALFSIAIGAAYLAGFASGYKEGIAEGYLELTKSIEEELDVKFTKEEKPKKTEP